MAGGGEPQAQFPDCHCGIQFILLGSNLSFFSPSSPAGFRLNTKCWNMLYENDLISSHDYLMANPH